MGDPADSGFNEMSSQMGAGAVSSISTLLPSLRWGAGEIRGHQGRLGHHHAAAGAVAGKPLGLPPHLEPRCGSWAGGRLIDLPGFGHSDGRPELITPDGSGVFLARLIDEWGLGVPHVIGPDVGTAAALFLAAKAPDRVSSLTIGGGAVRFPIDAGGALKEIIEAPTLDDVRALDARTNIGYAVEQAAPSVSEPEVHEDYVSAYDLGRFAESARFVRDLPRAEPGAARFAAVHYHADPNRRGAPR